MNEGALANLDFDLTLERIASGTLSKTIAAEYGVTPRGLRYALSRNRPDQYKQAVMDQAESIVENAVAYVETCDIDTVPIARVRADTAFRYAAARDPDRWSTKSGNITINNNLLTVPETIITQSAALLDQLRTVAVQQQIGDGALQSPDTVDRGQVGKL